MASENLPRVLQNIFGANATANTKTIAQFGSVIAGNPLFTGDIEEIQALQYWRNGWVGATISDKRYPTSEETTGINKVVTQQLAYLFQKGMPEWLDNETYFNGSFCQVKGVIYKSVKDKNINNNPVTDSGENWQIFRTSASETELENLMPYVQNGVIGSSLSLTNTHVPAGGVRYYNNGLTITTPSDSHIGIIGGFSNTNWLMLSKPFPSTVAYRVEHDFTCTLPQLDQTVFGYNFNDSVGIRNGKLSLITKGITYEGITELQANQKYYWMLTHADSDDTAMKLYIKTNLIDDWSLEVSIPIAFNVWADLSIYLGAAGNNPNTYFRGTMSTDLRIYSTATIVSNNEYYNMSKGASNAYDMLTVNGTLIGWCPDGRNTADQTLKNTSVTFNGNNNTILSETNKDIYFTLPDSRLIIGKTHEDTIAPTKNLEPGDVWYNPNTNINQIYSAVTPNLLNNGCTIASGMVSDFNTTNYIEPFGVFDLKDSWSIKLALGSNIDTTYYAGFLRCNGIKLYTTNGITSTAYGVQKTVEGVTTYGYVRQQGLNGSFVAAEVIVYEDADFTTQLGVATGSDYVYDVNYDFVIVDTTTRRTVAILYRDDIQKVTKQVEVGTSYQVAYQGIIGYVSIEGLIGAPVTDGVEIYSDSNLKTAMDTATGNTYIYTGNSSPIYDIIDGYAKTNGIDGQYLESGTIVYFDTNATITQEVADGTNYTFTDEYEQSIIATLYIPQTTLTKNITLNYNDGNYALSSEDGSTTFASLDYLKDNNIIELGRCVIDSDNIQYLINSSLDLNSSEFSFWTWNRINEVMNQWTPFIGIKFGHTEGFIGYINNTTTLNESLFAINKTINNIVDIINKQIIIKDTKINQSNGYIILSNNLCCQWGRFTAASSSAVDVIYPTKFANTQYTLVAMKGGINASATISDLGIVQLRTDGFRFQVAKSAGNSLSGYIAIGLIP